MLSSSSEVAAKFASSVEARDVAFDNSSTSFAMIVRGSLVPAASDDTSPSALMWVWLSVTAVVEELLGGGDQAAQLIGKVAERVDVRTAASHR